VTTREQTGATEEDQPLRADAARNRETIVRTAFEVLGERGVDAQMTEIAEAAGLGIGTVYRNFPSKEALVNALVLDRLRLARRSFERALTHDDAWTSLVHLIEELTKRQTENRVLSQFLGGRVAGSPELIAERDEVYAMLGKLVSRAKRSGQLRKDVNVADLRIIMTAVAYISASDSPLAHRLALRHVAILLDGLRAPGASKLPGPPLSLAESEEAFSYPQSARALRRGRRAWPSGA
jgi:AcrR family transcriptional regulator